MMKRRLRVAPCAIDRRDLEWIIRYELAQLGERGPLGLEAPRLVAQKHRIATSYVGARVALDLVYR